MSSGSGSLSRYILVRILLIIPMLWVLLTMVFFLLRVAPGDPVSAALGGRLDEEALDVRRAALGLDRPMIVQYFEYLGQVARFDFGQTISDNRPVPDLIRDNGGATLTLTVGAFLFALLIGLPLGRLAGRYRDTRPDVVIRIFGVITYAAPIFWVGIMLVLLVVELFPGWPTSGIASPITVFTVPTKTHILLVDSFLSGRRHGHQGRAAAPRAPVLHAGPAAVRRHHPTGPGQRDPGDEGRLRRGGPGSWHRRASTSYAVTPSATPWSPWSR